MTGTHDLDQMAAELAALRAQVAQLTAHQQETSPDDPAVSRRHLLRGLAGLGAAGAATAAGIATADPAAAADGDPLILGQENTASSRTEINHTTASSSGDWALKLSTDDAVGLHVSSPRTAIEAYGTGLASFGVLANTDDGIAVSAANDSHGFPALTGRNLGTGPGVAALSVHGPQLWLLPDAAGTIGPPTDEVRSIGQIKLDLDGDLWLCVADGTPGTWTRLLREDTATGRVVPITPLRVLDTRTATGQATGGPVVPGQIKGPLKGGQTLTLPLAGITPIPTTATGIVGNATVITPTGTGYLRLLPAGATTPASSFNFTNGTTIANGFTSALAPTGLSAIAPISPTITYHLVLDIAAYIT